jgi:hypothetical protein
MTMNKKSLMIGIAVAATLLVMLSAVAVSDEWSGMDEMTKIEYTLDDEGVAAEGSLNFVLFEEHGHVMFILALLLFGAIIGGAYVAKEGDDDDTN